MGAELFHADGQTDMVKLIVIFHNFANAPKNKILSNRKEEKLKKESAYIVII